jgi:hypothetical protein
LILAAMIALSIAWHLQKDQSIEKCGVPLPGQSSDLATPGHRSETKPSSF